MQFYLQKYTDGSVYRALLSMSYFADADPQQCLICSSRLIGTPWKRRFVIKFKSITTNTVESLLRTICDLQIFTKWKKWSRYFFHFSIYFYSLSSPWRNTPKRPPTPSSSKSSWISWNSKESVAWKDFLARGTHKGVGENDHILRPHCFRRWQATNSSISASRSSSLQLLTFALLLRLTMRE